MVPPLLAQARGDHLRDGAGRHRRGGVLQLRQRGPVRCGQLLRQRRLEHRQRLAELHRAALELTEHAEQLLRRTRLQLARDELRRPTADPLAEADGRATRHPQWEARELGAARDRPPGDVTHTAIVAPSSAAPHPHEGCAATDRRRSRPSASSISSTPPALDGGVAAAST